MSETVTIRTDLLEALLAEMRGLRSDFARHTASTGDALWLAELAEATGGAPFTAAEVMRGLKSRRDPLWSAVSTTLPVSTARGLGRALGRLATQPVAGFEVHRLGAESGGVIWKVAVVQAA